MGPLHSPALKPFVSEADFLELLLFPLASSPNLECYCPRDPQFPSGCSGLISFLLFLCSAHYLEFNLSCPWNFSECHTVSSFHRRLCQISHCKALYILVTCCLNYQFALENLYDFSLKKTLGYNLLYICEKFCSYMVP